jgi:HEAT repeat protein
MVTLHFLAIIKTFTFRIATGLFAFIFIFFLLYLCYVFFKHLGSRLRARARARMRDMLLGYMLEETGIESISFGRFQRSTFIEVFTNIVSLIRGKRQERLKEAVKTLGIIAYIENSLFSTSPVKRVRSCRMLGLLESRSSVDAIIRKLFDPNPKVVSAAIIAVGEIKDEKTLPALFKLFSVCSSPHAWLIASILPFFGKAVYEAIKPYLRPGNLPEKKLIFLLKVIGELQIVETIEELKALYTESSSIDVKIASMNAIGRLNDLFAVKTILDALSHPSWQIRAIACRIIGEMCIKGAAYRLIPLLKDSNYYVRKNAANALVSLGKLGITAMLAYLDVDDRYARDMIVQTLIERGIVDNAMIDLDGADDKKRNEALILIKSLIRKGYTDYLRNFRTANSTIGRLIEGAHD